MHFLRGVYNNVSYFSCNTILFHIPLFHRKKKEKESREHIQRERRASAKKCVRYVSLVAAQVSVYMSIYRGTEDNFFRENRIQKKIGLHNKHRLVHSFRENTKLVWFLGVAFPGFCKPVILCISKYKIFEISAK